jgi:hypothetical protein
VNPVRKVLSAIKENSEKKGIEGKKEYLETARSENLMLILKKEELLLLQSKGKEERKGGEENQVYQE